MSWRDKNEELEEKYKLLRKQRKENELINYKFYKHKNI
jgi:uncharacterized protein YigA (DUF484 family)